MKTIITVIALVASGISGWIGYMAAYQAPVIVPADLIKLASTEGKFCSTNSGPEQVVLRRAIFDAQHDDVTFICANEAHFLHVPFIYTDPAIDRKKRQAQIAEHLAAGLLPTEVVITPDVPRPTSVRTKTN